ncbi:MAG: ATP-binding cassette domain-containing protein, partial [Terriglobia bacterium]
ERARQDGHALPEEEIARRVRTLLDTVALGEQADSMPADLSTGMKRAVAIARALAAEPECILYDEPTTMVDPLMAQTITELILRLKQKHHKTSVVVTHDVRLAERVADRLVMLHQGRVAFFGTPEEWRASAEPEVESFRVLDALPGTPPAGF